MRTILSCLVCLTLLFSATKATFASTQLTGESIPTLASKTSLQEKDAFARSFAEKVLSIIQDATHKMEDRKEILRNAFRDSVDIQWIAKFVLGANLRKMNDAQKDTYIKTYRRYLTETYVSNFAEDPDKRIRDITIRKVYDNNSEDFTVRTNMLLANGEKLTVSYLINEYDGHYRIRDFAIENVSLIASHRNELSQLATERGVDQLIAELEDRIKKMQNHEADYSIR